MGIVALQWLARFVLPVVAPDATIYGVIGGLAGGAAVLVWWLLVGDVLLVRNGEEMAAFRLAMRTP